MTLPCRHEERITKQVQPTINLLTNIHELHPDVLLQHEIQPDDYKKSLVFRSAIESIRGTFIASSTASRLDGAIVNQPANGAHSIINRVTNEMVMWQKLVDVLFFKDILCGRINRHCPKYPGRETTIQYQTAPDIFLLRKI